jgi:adenylate kinase family enzyme
MKYLKKYKLFLEENEFDIKDSDAEDVKMSKEKLNDLKNQIAEYNQNKSKVIDLYKKANSIEEANEELKKILGEDSESRNSFLVQLANMSKECQKRYI